MSWPVNHLKVTDCNAPARAIMQPIISNIVYWVLIISLFPAWLLVVPPWVTEYTNHSSDLCLFCVIQASRFCDHHVPQPECPECQQCTDLIIQARKYTRWDTGRYFWKSVRQIIRAEVYFSNLTSSVTRISNFWPNTNTNIFGNEMFTEYEYRIYS